MQGPPVEGAELGGPRGSLGLQLTLLPPGTDAKTPHPSHSLRWRTMLKTQWQALQVWLAFLITSTSQVYLFIASELISRKWTLREKRLWSLLQEPKPHPDAGSPFLMLGRGSRAQALRAHAYSRRGGRSCSVGNPGQGDSRPDRTWSPWCGTSR